MRELRTLLPKEQGIVRKLAELKGDGRNINLQNYQAGRILEQIVGFNFAAIKWDVTKQEPIEIFYEKDEERDEAFSSFFALCDFLYLLEELQNAGLIAVQSVLFDEDRLLYNRNKHKREEFDNWHFNKEQIGVSYLVPGRGIQTYRIDIVDYLENYLHLKIIYPRPAFFEYVANEFMTVEQVRHDEEMGNLNKQLKATRRSAWYAFATLIVTAGLGLCQHYSSTRIESHDLESIAKSFQYLNSSQLPVNTAIVSDTIMAIDTLYTDSCNKTVSASPITSEQSEVVSVGLQKDTSIITTNSVTKDTVVIQTKKQ